MGAPTAETLVEETRGLLERGDLDSLLLGALKLRMAIEAITYRKLSGYTKYVPARVLQTWQPAHAMKMLLQFEPDADSNYTVYMGLQKEKGVPAEPTFCLGEHRTFDVRWLQRNYHKLGSYLHYPLVGKPEIDTRQLAASLDALADEIGSVAQSPVYSFTMGARIPFECLACGTKCLANLDAIRESGSAECIDPNCSAVHRFEEAGDGWSITLAATEFKCLECEHVFGVEDRFLKLGNEFACPDCGAQHVWVECRWGYEISDAFR